MSQLVTRQPPSSLEFPFEALEAAPQALREQMEREALRVNCRYLEEFLEKYAFCPYSRGARKKNTVSHYVYYCDSHDPAPLVRRMAAIAADPQQVVAQVIFPAVDVTPKDWIRFSHDLTAYAHAQIGGGAVLACAPLHPELPYTTSCAEGMIPLFRRTPDPTIQWVRLDGLAAIYKGRGGDTVFVEPSSIMDYVATASTRPDLYQRIAETNAAMAKRLTFPIVEDLLADIARDAQKSYARIFLGVDPAATTAADDAESEVAQAGEAPRAHHHEATPHDGGLVKVATWSALLDRAPVGVVVAGVELVVVRYCDKVSVLEGRCPHRAALLATGQVDADHLVCREHGWDFRLEDGKSSCVAGEALCVFKAHIDAAADAVLIDPRDVDAWKLAHPTAFQPDEFDDELSAEPQLLQLKTGPGQGRSPRRGS